MTLLNLMFGDFVVLVYHVRSFLSTDHRVNIVVSTIVKFEESMVEGKWKAMTINIISQD